jgi:hypothetical protein
MNQQTKSMTTSARPGRAAILITRLVASGTATPERIAQALHITPERLDNYASGREAMPLNLQARLSIYVIASFPQFVRLGNHLRHQVAAAINYEAGTTDTHEEPVSRWRVR